MVNIIVGGKNRMQNFIQAEDYELWMLIKNGPLIPTKIIEDGTEEFNAEA